MGLMGLFLCYPDDAAGCVGLCVLLMGVFVVLSVLQVRCVDFKSSESPIFMQEW